MEITEVKEPGKLKAAASITIDECFVVHDLRVVETETGLFVAMPNKRMGTGEFRDVAHPINNDTRDYISKLVIDKYQEELSHISAPQE